MVKYWILNKNAKYDKCDQNNNLGLLGSLNGVSLNYYKQIIYAK